MAASHNENYEACYDVELVDNGKQETNDEIICTICHLVLRNPVQVTPCGHRFGQKCLKRFHKEK